MRAVIYARFSCSKQREASIEDQLRVCRDWCAREGFEVVREYCDEALSGRTDARPAFQEMVANAGESDVVLVYMLDRFSRDPYDAPIYKQMLARKGVRVVSAMEALPEGPDAVLLEKIYEGLAAVESAHISQRTRRGMEGNALKCMHNGVPVFGYRFSVDGRYEVDPEQAETVRECFARRLQGEPVNAIAEDLAARGVRTTTGRPVGHTFVDHLLKNEKYKGVYSWGGVRVEDGMPAIVDPVEFDAAQRVRGRKVRAEEDWRTYPLSGGVGVCECGHALVGASTRKPSGARYEYYRCGVRCGVRPVRADWLEAAAVDCVRHVLQDPACRREVASAVAGYADDTQTAARLANARKRRETARRGIDNILQAVENGLYSPSMQGRLDALEAEAAAADDEVTALEAMPAFDADDFAAFLEYAATFEDARLLEAFVFQVMVGPEFVTVTLNYDIDGAPARYRTPVNEETANPDGVGGVFVWLPTCEIMLTVDAGRIVLRMPRAA